MGNPLTDRIARWAGVRPPAPNSGAIEAEGAEVFPAGGDLTPDGLPRSRQVRRSTAFLAGTLAGGNLIAMVLRLAGAVLLARLVVPSTLGLFNGIGIALGYASVLQLGVLNGLNRELPFFVGKGDRERVKDLAAAGQAWALMVGAVVFVALSAVAGWELAHGENWKAAGWFTNAVLGVLFFYSTSYMQNTFRSAHDFARLAVVNVAETVVSLIFLGFVALLGFYGLCVRSVLISVVSAIMLFLWRPVRVGPKWNYQHFKHLLIIGAPILGVGLLYSWWLGVINSTLVLKLMGTEGVGLYSMVLMASTALDVIPIAVAQVIYPRMAENYGRNPNLRELILMARKPTLLTVAVLVPAIAVAWFVVGPVARFVVPAYAAAVPAMQWALLLPLVGSLQTVNSLFNVARRQDLYLAAIVIGIAVYVGGLLLLTRNGIYLAAFPQAMLVGRVAYTVASYAFIFWLHQRERGAS